MNILPARIFATDVPPNLPAMVFNQRPRIGPTVRVLAVGDLGFSGRVAATAASKGYNEPLKDISLFFNTGDIVFGNLEYPLLEINGSDGMFAGNPQAAASLRSNGFDIIHLANNHVGEYGVEGLTCTLNALRMAGLFPLGAGWDLSAARSLVRTDRNGLKIGWLGCGRTLLTQNEPGPRYWEFNERELTDAIKNARDKVNVLIVSVHIGFMYIDYPHPQHKAMAERLMNTGADLILMHHAHVLQGVQTTAEGKVSCYNLGNFLLDWREGNVEMPIMVKEQNEGAVFVFDIDKRGVFLAAALPTYIDKDCIVRWAVNDRGHEILSRLDRITRALDGSFTADFERQRAERNTSGILKVLWFHARRGNWLFVLKALRKTRVEHLVMLIRCLRSALCSNN